MKLIERVIEQRRRSYPEDIGFINKYESGFRLNKSTDDHLFMLSQSVMARHNRGEHVVAAFLEVEKAFDNVWHNGLRCKIFMLDLPNKMTRWLSDFLVGRVIRVNVNGFLSDKISPVAGIPQGPLLFLICVNDLPKPHHRQNSKSQFADDTALWVASKNVQYAAKRLRKDLRKLAKWCAKWRIKLNSEKPRLFSRSSLARNSETILKLNGERLKIYPQAKFLGITFNSKFTFQKHFEEILGPCITRYHRIRLLSTKNGDPACPPYYKSIKNVSSLSTITTSDTYHQQNATAPEQIYPACPVFTQKKNIGVKLLHDSSGLPYVKDRLLSCAARTLGRISKNPLVEGSITFNRVNPAWDRFPTPLSIILPVSLQITMTCRGNFSKHPIAPETGSPAYTRTCLAQSSDFKSQAITDYSASLPF